MKHILFFCLPLLVLMSCGSETTEPTYTKVGDSYVPAHEENSYSFKRTTYDKNGAFVDSSTIKVVCDSMKGSYNFKNSSKSSTVYLVSNVKAFQFSLSDFSHFYIGVDNNSSAVYLGTATMDANNIKGIAKLTGYSTAATVSYDDGSVMTAKNITSVTANGVNYKEICVVDVTYRSGAVQHSVSYFAKGVGLVRVDSDFFSGNTRTDVLLQADLH